jgi:hypothetical protein
MNTIHNVGICAHSRDIVGEYPYDVLFVSTSNAATICFHMNLASVLQAEALRRTVVHLFQRLVTLEHWMCGCNHQLVAIGFPSGQRVSQGYKYTNTQIGLQAIL